jgi:hypothetical protein
MISRYSGGGTSSGAIAVLGINQIAQASEACVVPSSVGSIGVWILVHANRGDLRSGATTGRCPLRLHLRQLVTGQGKGGDGGTSAKSLVIVGLLERASSFFEVRESRDRWQIGIAAGMSPFSSSSS